MVVVKHGYVIYCILLSFDSRLVVHPMNSLLFHAAKEAFCDSVSQQLALRLMLPKNVCVFIREPILHPTVFQKIN